MKFFLTLLIFPLTLWGQTWTDPINISPNLPGLDNQPDLCIDKNGTLHCVFTHKLASNWRKIYYTKSTNDGETWTTPEDISLNPDTTLYSPHIVADTNNRLYVTYDYNSGSPAALLIKLKYFDGNQWSEAFTVSEGMFGSEYNQMFIDKNNRIYVFWIYQTEKTYYRYFENNIWSEIIYPYPGNFNLIFSSAKIDVNNNLLCVGSYSQPGPPVIPQTTIFFKYDYFDDEWSEKTFISSPTDYGGDGGMDIDLFSNSFPAVTYRQRTYGTGPFNDSTMYTFFNGSTWSEPDLVVNDPYEQKIAIDPYNRVHIIDREKLETGTKLVHYQKINNMWQGYIIDEADNLTSFPDLTYANGQLYLLYNKSDIPELSDIYISKFDITTGIKNDPDHSRIKTLDIYPNPFKTQTTIEFKTNKQQQINVSIFNLNGQHIKTLMNENTQPGTYRLLWNGKGKNGKEYWVIPGLYLVRLQSGRNIITKPVNYLK
ncbi:MAG: T9SS type A sorting domain-containing protein [Bacteroidales bacterium]